MMQKEIVKKRCACYCRKSTDENLDTEFNSLDAQREACESYISSQKANGWICLPERYEDGGYSGGNTKRPALQKMLADCKNGLIDIVIVYKLDRLSRSIVDFADMSKMFDEWGVQFVSVTQDINTATSSGRMMLNILVTFSQYEREVITERIRDKVSASKLRGMWTGGCVPLGYKVVDKKLVVIPEEAKTVKRIFQRFIEVQSPKLIAAELNEEGVKPKYAKKWNMASVYNILNNYTYNGEVKYKENICKGEQAAIVTPEVWTRTREIMKCNTRVSHKGRSTIIAPLKGILKCGHCGCAMMPTYGSKGSHKYFYYLCEKDAHSATPECPIHLIPAGEVEEIVRLQLKQMLSEPGMVAKFAEKCGLPPREILNVFQKDFWSAISPGEMNRLVSLLIERAVIWTDHIELELKTSGLMPLMEEIKNAGN